MMNHLIRVIQYCLLLMIFAAYTPCYASTNNAKNLIIVVGKPVKEKFLRTAESESGQLVMGGWYRVSLKDVKVIRGDIKLPKRVFIDLRALDSGLVTKHDQIFIIVDHGKDNNLRGLWWDTYKYSICAPSGVIENSNLNSDFKEQQKSKLKCATY